MVRIEKYRRFGSVVMLIESEHIVFDPGMHNITFTKKPAKYTCSKRFFLTE
jgi:hypothetical protein